MLSNETRTRWSYPALRAWAKARKLPDHRIDILVMGARREKAPLWAVEKRNGRWASLTKDAPVDIEYFFAHNHTEMLNFARDKLAA